MNSDLEREIDQILWQEWDPIGVNGHDRARGEYRRYIDEIAALVRRHAAANEFITYLDQIRMNRMEIEGHFEKTRLASQRLAKLGAFDRAEKQNFTISIFDDPGDVERADRERYRAMSGQEKLDLMIDLVRRWGKTDERPFERVARLVDLS